MQKVFKDDDERVAEAGEGFPRYLRIPSTFWKINTTACEREFLTEIFKQTKHTYIP